MLRRTAPAGRHSQSASAQAPARLCILELTCGLFVCETLIRRHNEHAVLLYSQA